MSLDAGLSSKMAGNNAAVSGLGKSSATELAAVKFCGGSTGFHSGECSHKAKDEHDLTRALSGLATANNYGFNKPKPSDKLTRQMEADLAEAAGY